MDKCLAIVGSGLITRTRINIFAEYIVFNKLKKVIDTQRCMKTCCFFYKVFARLFLLLKVYFKVFE